MTAFYSLIVLLLIKLSRAGPVPNFGLPVSVAGSAQVISASNQTSAVVKSATNHLGNVSLASNYTKHQTVLVQLAMIANFTASVDQSIVMPLLALAEATSGNVSELFNAIWEGIATTQSYITHTLPGDLKKLEIEIDHYVPDRLKDGFGCVQRGLDSLSEALKSLQNGVLNAVREAGTNSMSNVELRKFVSLKVVNDVARSIRAVSVCFPSIVETVNSTSDRLKTADQFIIDTSRADELTGV
ncbi:uncharacterized protein LOC133391010 [Anopheles gambiae]|uniref:uncharacterized protein LOC133391010 n=1 Tax=Anopheles gambiae TaxID=7165 RepID=UPI002AC89A62|nr:uncharacterized protein LOC133391010 [Anopheles gambiae]